MDFSKTKIRCSSLGKIMSAIDKPVERAETCRKHLIQIYVNEKYGREFDIDNKYQKF